jgi:tRNA-modifying protein YgfZ
MTSQLDRTSSHQFSWGAREAAYYLLSKGVVLSANGSDTAKFLHNFCTADVKKLLPGQAAEAFFTNVKGRVIQHGWVLRTEAGADVFCPAGVGETLLTHLDRYLITEDVQLALSDLEVLVVCGPEAPKVLEESFPAWARVAVGTSVALGPDMRAARLSWLSVPTYMLLVKDVTAAIQSIKAAGITPLSDDDWETVRIASGFPTYGIDISDETLAQEVGRTPRAISFTKGCYLGQEPIARIDALGHINRQLRLTCSDELITVGASVLLGEAVIGTITSASKQRMDGLYHQLAMLRVKGGGEGAQLYVAEPARVPLEVKQPRAELC